MSTLAIGLPDRAPALRLQPRAIGPRIRARLAVAVVRDQPALPSLAAARLVAVRRASGAAVRLVEIESGDRHALPRLLDGRGGQVDHVDLVEADGSIVDPAPELVALLRSGERHPLVPDFGDLEPARTRVLPIAVGVVLHEVREYMRRHHAPDLVFVDAALNRIPHAFEGLVGSIQSHAPGVQWMAALAVGASESEDGLSRRLLRTAATAGLRSVVLRVAPADADRAATLAGQAGDAGIAVRIPGEGLGVRTHAMNLRAALAHSTPFDDVALGA